MKKPKIKLVKKLNDKGFPVHSRNYKEAHEYANKIEKKKYPTGYEKLKKLERKMPKHELMGKNTKSGKIEVERKYSKYKTEIGGTHEPEEHREIDRLKRLAIKRKRM